MPSVFKEIFSGTDIILFDVICRMFSGLLSASHKYHTQYTYLTSRNMYKELRNQAQGDKRNFFDAFFFSQSLITHSQYEIMVLSNYRN